MRSAPALKITNFRLKLAPTCPNKYFCLYEPIQFDQNSQNRPFSVYGCKKALTKVLMERANIKEFASSFWILDLGINEDARSLKSRKTSDPNIVSLPTVHRQTGESF